MNAASQSLTRPLAASSPASAAGAAAQSAGTRTSKRRYALSPAVIQALASGALMGFAVAAGFIAAQASGLERPMGDWAWLAALLLLAVYAGLMQLSLVEVRRGAEGTAFRLEAMHVRQAALQNEVALLREIVRSLSRPSPQSPRQDQLRFGTLGQRPCAVLGDGAVIVETLVGYRRFESLEDAEAFVGEKGVRLAE